jgi:NAD+ synthase (glutamine-hydrolysing)
MKVIAGQLNFTVGALQRNYEKICKVLSKNKKYDIIAFPELGLMGYPPFDLLFKRSFLKEEEKYLLRLAMKFPEKPIIIGSAVKIKQLPKNKYDSTAVNDFPYKLYNVVKILFKGKVIGFQTKFNLPTYDVFNEYRYFSSGKDVKLFYLIEKNGCVDDIIPFTISGKKLINSKFKEPMTKKEIENFYKGKGKWLGLSICEDLWIKESVPYIQGKFGVDLLINVSASPYYKGNKEIREKILKNISKKYATDVIYVNPVGAQDFLIYDGESYHYKNGILMDRSESFKEQIKVFNTKKRSNYIPVRSDHNEEIFQALTLGISDYFKKNDFKKALIGLSGGIDSAIVALLASASLDPKNILGILMPGPYSSEHSVKDAVKLSKNLGIGYEIINITSIYEEYIETISKYEKIKKYSVTEQNIQARIRGNILMAYANNMGGIVLSTGNKSELAVGYSTLYGDLAGGIAVISDLYKTTVYKLARYINKIYDWKIIPENIIEKPPSAELKPDQMDQDDLPPYPILDQVLKFYIEKHLSANEISQKGFDKKMILSIIKKVDRNEYKRKQAPFGFKLTPKSFGFGRIMPINQKYEKR